jgi:hypothetical protein
MAFQSTPLTQKDSEKKQCCMACCKHKNLPKPIAPVKNKCCGDMSCNPFAQYACCTGFIISDKQTNPEITANTFKPVHSNPLAFIQDFNSGCFHPPESV